MNRYRGVAAIGKHAISIELSNRYINAKCFDLAPGREGSVRAQVSSRDPVVADQLPNKINKSDKAACAVAGAVLAKRLQDEGITDIHWHMGPGDKYHGRLKSFIDSLRDSGIRLC